MPRHARTGMPKPAPKMVGQESALLVSTGSASYTSIHVALQIPFVSALNLEAEVEGLPAIIGLYNTRTANVRINPYLLLTLVLKEVGLKLSPRCISASRLAKNTIPTTTPMFSRLTFSIVLSEVPISQFVNNIGTKFQRQYPCFRGRATREDKWQYYPMSG